MKTELFEILALTLLAISSPCQTFDLSQTVNVTWRALLQLEHWNFAGSRASREPFGLRRTDATSTITRSRGRQIAGSGSVTLRMVWTHESLLDQQSGSESRREDGWSLGSGAGRMGERHVWLRWS